MASKNPKRQPSKAAKSKRPLAEFAHGKTVVAALILGILVFFAAPLTGSHSLWGFVFPAYAPGIELYIFLAAALAALVWAVLPSAPGNAHQEPKPALNWVLAGITAGGLALLISNFPVAFAFLGDGSIYIGEVFRLAATEGHVSSLTKATTWLGGWLVTWVAGAIELSKPGDAFQTAGLWSGMIMITGLFVLLRKERFPIVLLWTLLLLGTGGMLMYFGYVELYALGYAFATLYLVACWAFFRGHNSAVIPGILLVLAIASTASNAIFIPSYLLLLHWKMRGMGGKPNLKQSAVLLAILPAIAIIVLYVAFGMGAGNPYLIPLTSFVQVENGVSFGTQSYTLFSGIHLLDVVNALYLAGGVSAVLVLVVLLAGKSVNWSAPVAMFALVATAGTLLLCLTGNATFGMGRDWDLMIAAGPALAFLVIAALVDLWERKQVPLTRLLPLIAVLALAPVFSWVKVNYEPNTSALRFTHLVEYYEPVVTPAYTYNALENLRKFYFAESMPEEYIQTQLQKGATRYDMLGTYRELIGYLKRPEAVPYAEQGFRDMFTIVAEAAEHPLPETDFRHLPVKTLRQFAVQALLGANEASLPGVAQEFIPQFRNAFLDWPEFVIYEAYQFPREEPRKRYEAIRGLDRNTLTDIALVIRAANTAKNAGQLQEAVGLFERALELDPHQYQNVYLTLAELYYRGFQNKPKSMETLQRCITNCVGSEAAEKAKQILAQLQSEG